MLFWVTVCCRAELDSKEERRQYDLSMDKMTVKLKMAELRISSLMESLKKEKTENSEMQKLIDLLTTSQH